MKIRVDILVNNEFFIKRHCSYFNKEISKTSAVDIAKCLKFIVWNMFKMIKKCYIEFFLWL